MTLRREDAGGIDYLGQLYGRVSRALQVEISSRSIVSGEEGGGSGKRGIRVLRKALLSGERNLEPEGDASLFSLRRGLEPLDRFRGERGARPRTRKSNLNWLL